MREPLAGPPFTLSSAEAEDTEAFGARLATTLPPWREHQVIVFLEGDLGAGKTTLARGFLHAAGITGSIKSPTYTLLETYEVPGAPRHAALTQQRLRNQDDLALDGGDHALVPAEPDPLRASTLPHEGAAEQTRVDKPERISLPVPADVIIHLDLYRLQEAAELEPLGLRDLARAGFVWLIEWPARGESHLPPADVSVRLSVADKTHDIEVSAHSPLGQAWLARLRA